MFSLNIFSEPLQFLISAAAEIKTVSTRGPGPQVSPLREQPAQSRRLRLPP